MPAAMVAFVQRLVRQDRLGLAVAAIGFAENVILVGRDAIVVGRAAQQHDTCRHHRTLGGFDHRQMAGAAAFARDAIIGRVDEAHEFRRFLVEQRIAALGVRRRRKVPGFGEARQHMRIITQLDIGGIGLGQPGGCQHPGVATMAIGAAQRHRFGRVHRPFVAGRMAGQAAGAFGIGGRLRLVARRGGRRDKAVIARDRVLAFRRRGDDRNQRHQNGNEPEAKIMHVDHQYDRIALNKTL